MSFARAHHLSPVGRSPRAQKIEFEEPSLKLKKRVYLYILMNFRNNTNYLSQFRKITS